MHFRALKGFKVETSNGETTIQPGKNVKLSRDLAISLLNQGRITPIGRAAVKIYSEVLGEEIWIVADERDMKALQAEHITDVVYMASEVEELKGKPPEHIKKVHEAKRVFPGSKVVGDE